MSRSCGAALAAAGLLLTVSPGDAAEDARHNLLYYVRTSTGPQPLDEATVRPLLAYTSADGQPIDWLFDGIVLYSWAFAGGATNAELAEYRDYLFGQGRLQELANTVGGLRTELGDPDYRLKVYLTAPLFFPNGPPNANANVDLLYDDYQAVAPPELELVGFYWGHRESIGGAESYEVQTAAHVHGMGLQFVWIPSFLWTEDATIAEVGFDRAALQPNYHKHDIGWSRFQDVDNRILTWGLSGAEVEASHVENDTIVAPALLNNALDYFRAFDHYNWTERRWNAYYYGPRLGEFAAPGDHRPIYDGLYRTVAAHPRRSVARREVLLPVADAFVELLPSELGNQNGGLEWLDVGVNGLGNETISYLKFELPPSALVPVAAHLRLSLFNVVESSYLNQADICLCPSDWDELIISGAARPSCDDSPFGTHRFHVDAPATHHIDVTDEIAQAAAGPVSFMIQGHDPGSIGIAMFRAKEAGDPDEHPRLTIVYPGPEPEQPDAGAPDGAAGPGGAGGTGGGPVGGVRGDGSTANGACGCRTRGREGHGLPVGLLLALLLWRRRAANDRPPRASRRSSPTRVAESW